MFAECKDITAVVTLGFVVCCCSSTRC